MAYGSSADSRVVHCIMGCLIGRHVSSMIRAKLHYIDLSYYVNDMICMSRNGIIQKENISKMCLRSHLWEHRHFLDAKMQTLMALLVSTKRSGGVI